MHMMIRLIFITSLFISTSSYALEKCDKNIQPLQLGEDDRFSLVKSEAHTDWVLMRFIITKNGVVNEVKPMKFSSDLYINRAHKRVKKIVYPPLEKACYHDLVLHHKIVR